LRITIRLRQRDNPSIKRWFMTRMEKKIKELVRVVSGERSIFHMVVVFKGGFRGVEGRGKKKYSKKKTQQGLTG